MRVHTWLVRKAADGLAHVQLQDLQHHRGGLLHRLHQDELEPAVIVVAAREQVGGDEPAPGERRAKVLSILTGYGKIAPRGSAEVVS